MHCVCTTENVDVATVDADNYCHQAIYIFKYK